MNLQHENERFFRRLNRSSSTSDINKNGLSAVVFKGSINFGVGRNQRLFFLSIKKRDIGKNFRYNKITTNYRKEISLCPLLILSYLFSI